MSANELQNRVEAACWLRNGPAPGDGPYDNPTLYFRCQNGFENAIGRLNAQSPQVLLLLDRPYTRNETAVFVFPVNTADIVYEDGVPSVVTYPATPQIVPQCLPVDRRLFLDPTFVTPTDPLEQVALFETYDALLITPLDFLEGETLFTDLCVKVLRVPRGPVTPPTIIPFAVGGPS